NQSMVKFCAEAPDAARDSSRVSEHFFINLPAFSLFLVFSLRTSLHLCLLCYQISQVGNALLQRLNFHILLLDDFIQPLDGCQRDTVGVNGGDGLIVLTDLKGCGKVLGYRADMANSGVLALVAPGLNGDTGKALQTVAPIRRSEIVFAFPVTE